MAEPRRNLACLLDELSRRRDRPAFALRTPYRRFTWTAGEIGRAALAQGARLAGAGVARGDCVLLLGPNSPEWVAAFFAIVAAGGVVVPLDAGASTEFCRRVAARVGARAALVAADRLPALEGSVPRIDTLESLRVRRRPDGRRAASAADPLESGHSTLRDDADEAACEPPLETPHDAHPDDTAEIVFTSGTTAQPKGVELSHANLLVNLAGIEAGFLKWEPCLRPLLPLRLLCLVPLSHLLGQAVGLFAPILLRSTSVYSSTLQPARLLEAIRRERPLAVMAVPRTLAALEHALRRELGRRGVLERFEHALRRAGPRAPPLRILATRSVRRVLGWRTWAFVVGGAAVDPEVEDFWTACGFALIQGYGMTEAAPIISVRNPFEGVRRTIGRRIGSQEVRLAPDGEILVRGPNVMKGYYGDPGATREVLEDGWLRTGDLAEQDDAGRLYFKGRKKDIIVTADGMNVFPSDVEGVLGDIPGVRDAVAFALAGAQGDEVHAAIRAERTEVDAQAVRREANERLLPHQRLRGVIVWDAPDFPRTSTGKVRRSEVAAVALALLSGKGREAAAALPDPERPSRVLAALGCLRAGAEPGIDARARLAEDLGLSSLEMIELIGLLEEEHDVAIDDRQVQGSLTVGDLDRLVVGGGEAALRVQMPRWARLLPARWVRSLLRAFLVRPIVSLFVRLEVEGRERLGSLRGPFLVVSNHTSPMDVPAVLFSLPRRLSARLMPAMAIETLPEHFEPEGKPALRRLRSAVLYNLAVLLFGAYPLPQSRGFRPSLEYTGELIDAGYSPLVFPEGEMTRIGRMLPFKRGIGLLAIETRVPVLPVRLDGLAAILAPDSRWPRGGRARVSLGAPFDPLEGAPGDPAAVAARIEDAVRSL